MSRPLRVLLVSFIPAHTWTGMGRWTHEVLEGLRHAGHDARAWYDREFPVLARAGRLAVLLAPLAVAVRVVRRREQVDVIVVHEPLGFWYGLLRKVWRALPPMLVMCHNVESRSHRDLRVFARAGLADPPSRLRAPLMRHWQTNGAIRSADHVVCLSQADRADIVERLGVDATRVTVMTNGTTRDDFVEPTGSPTGSRVLWVGGWLDVKGRKVLPRLWHAVRTHMPNAALTLVGTDAAEDDVLAAFQPADRESVVVPPRARQREEMRRHYAEHDLFLLTSLSEGSPLALLEAMAAGLPIVATHAGGVPDLVTDGTEALLFHPRRPLDGAEQVGALLTDQAQARALGAAARDRAAALTWRAAAGTLGEAIATAVRRSGVAP